MKLVVAPKIGALNSTPRSHRVLALMPDSQTGLAIVRALGQRGLKVFSVCHPPWGGYSPVVAHSRYCSGCWTIECEPRASQLAAELAALARQLDIGSIMPMMEPHVSNLVCNRRYFEQDIHLFVPPTESFQKAVDKDYMHRLCIQLGVPVARGTTLDKLMESRDKLSLEFPLALRVRNKHLVNDEHQPTWKVAYAKNEQELQKLYKIHRRIASNMLVQEYHPGVEYFSQILMHRGQAFMDGEYMGEHSVPLAGGVTVRRVTCRHERMRCDTIRILQAIGWDGIAGVQFHYDPRTDKYIFLEVNPRFLRAVATPIRAGFDAPYLLWQSHFEPEKMVVQHYKLGLRMRSLGGDARWMFAMVRGELLPPDQKRLSKISTILRFLWHFGPWTKDEIFLLSDLKPFWVQWKSRIRLLCKRLFARVTDRRILENSSSRWKKIKMQFKRVDQVVGWRLCTGCGACVPGCPNKAITLVDILEQGIRPIVDPSRCQKCGDCVKVCPGIEVSHEPFEHQIMPELRQEWGPIMEVWEGYATDSQIRYNGSSGGLVTALALFCLEKQNASGVLHIGTRPEVPLKNVAVFSKSKQELLASTGSRYSPAAPCEKLGWIQQASSSCVFIGKPCDVVALRKSQAVNPVLNEKVNLAISIFCAGTPATEGTYNLLSVLGVKPEEVEELRYRGCGWPGMTTVKIKGCDGEIRQMTYAESLRTIWSTRAQLRCRLCPDSTGEFADISCGDPWYRKIEPDELGSSLVLVRTELGRRILHEAMEAGFIELESVRPEMVAASQKSLLNRRRNLFGRLLAMRIMCIPVPCYTGFSLFRSWLELRVLQKIRSFGGTLTRIILHGWIRPMRQSSQTTKIKVIWH
jgi:coenzyme F420 hydrogenase subunit beta